MGASRLPKKARKETTPAEPPSSNEYAPIASDARRLSADIGGYLLGRGNPPTMDASSPAKSSQTFEAIRQYHMETIRIISERFGKDLMALRAQLNAHGLEDRPLDSFMAWFPSGGLDSERIIQNVLMRLDYIASHLGSPEEMAAFKLGAGRILTPNDTKILIRELSGVSDVNLAIYVGYLPNDPEAKRYADQFSQAFRKAAGWKFLGEGLYSESEYGNEAATVFGFSAGLQIFGGVSKFVGDKFVHAMRRIGIDPGFGQPLSSRGRQIPDRPLTAGPDYAGFTLVVGHRNEQTFLPQ
jgi:hypothetical protein